MGRSYFTVSLFYIGLRDFLNQAQTAFCERILVLSLLNPPRWTFISDYVVARWAISAITR